jgi:hypothetical protein
MPTALRLELVTGPGPGPAGALIRPAAMLGLARRAGYAGGQILPIEHPVWRFCWLVR